MQTPGLLVFGAGVSKDTVQRTVGYAKTAEAISERMIEQTAVVGTAQECVKKVEEIEKAGATRVILYPMAIDGDYDRGVKAVFDAFGR